MTVTLVFQRGNYHITNVSKSFTISQNKDLFVGRNFHDENLVNLGFVIECHWTPLIIEIPEDLTYVEKVKVYLTKMLESTVWAKVQRVQERVDFLVDSSLGGIKIRETIYTAEREAQGLYEYEIHTLNRAYHTV